MNAEARFRGGIGVDGSDPIAQDLCAQTVDYPPAYFGDQPLFALGPSDVRWTFGGVEIPVSDFQFAGTFAGDGLAIDDASISGNMDTRPLASLLDASDDGAMCDLAASFGATCGDCRDGTPYCLLFLVERMTAPEVSGVTLAEVATGC